jgi:hypothetical protein
MPVNIPKSVSSFPRNVKIQKPTIPRAPAQSTKPVKCAGANTEPVKRDTAKTEPVKRDTANIYHSDPFILFKKLRKIKQASLKVIWSYREEDHEMALFKEINYEEEGRAEFEMLKAITSKHILAVRDSFSYNGAFYLGLEFAPYTLQEIIAVKSILDEPQIRVMAFSVS